MKIEQLLIQHFYTAKEVTLQGIGTFILSPDLILPVETGKDLVISENAITFTYNIKAREDDALIGYIVQQTSKIKPLAAADLDSYLILGKQFLNIGKPFRIEGLGKLEKNQSGQYEFTQGSFFSSKKEIAAPLHVSIKEKDNEDDISFAAPAKRSVTSKKGLIITVLLVAVVMTAAVSWYFFLRQGPNTQEALIPLTINRSTDTTRSGIEDTTVSKNPAISAAPDGHTFKIVFKVTPNKGAAIAKMNDLIGRGHKVIMYTKDSVNYFLAEPFNLPLSDTARIKDSLNSYYYVGKAYVERD